MRAIGGVVPSGNARRPAHSPTVFAVDGRELYAALAYDSMFAFCTGELGFSEDSAYNRITVARRARDFPGMLDALRSRRIHLTGLRLLAPHLTEANHQELLAGAAGKTKGQIEEVLASMFPKPPVPTSIRKLPQQSPRPVAHVKKQRFGVGCKPRKPARAPQVKAAACDPAGVVSRPPPMAARRAVFERDGGRCTYVDERGRRCCATKGLEIDHIDGFARTHSHDVSRMRLLCKAHDKYAANQLYGWQFMERAREARRQARPGAGEQGSLL